MDARMVYEVNGRCYRTEAAARRACGDDPRATIYGFLSNETLRDLNAANGTAAARQAERQLARQYGGRAALGRLHHIGIDPQ